MSLVTLRGGPYDGQSLHVGEIVGAFHCFAESPREQHSYVRSKDEPDIFVYAGPVKFDSTQFGKGWS